ncbi:MAG: dihydrofolate reductase [Candidatus Pacebacteria bacterium]|nr:dihydrofolate reductase [Candidatus Paceibacterota bacterium]
MHNTTHRPIVSLIAALGIRTRAIGKDNALLWHIPGDLPRFKALTVGHPIIMGSKTFESIGRPLPDRTNLVLTTDPAWSHEGVVVCATLEDALANACATGTDEVFVIGGGSVYAQSIELADRLYLTLVDDDTEGDVHFPDYTRLSFSETSREEHTETLPHFTWITFERVR